MIANSIPFWQTFIRNAAGKALVDSPALNAHSKAVLIPLARPPPLLSGPLNVPGPGPAEPHLRKPSPPPIPAGADTSKPPPPIPTEPTDLLDMNEASSNPVAPDVDDDDAIPNAANDPYSNIDGAFGNYMADEPQPMAAGKGTRGDLDDLLF